MKILFLTTGRMDNMYEYSLYPDLLRKFIENGHQVYSVSAYEKRTGKDTECKIEAGVHCLRVRVGNITKCGIIEKGISTLLIETQYKCAIKKYFSDVRFDLVLYSTPPITLVNVVKYIKTRDSAKSYLMLKDIFPQNALDLGVLKRKGISSVLYSFFREKEKRLYEISDTIGCMSEANCDYVIKHNPEIEKEKVEVCPNCIEIQDLHINEEDRHAIRLKYGLPKDKKVLVYGGNLGKPQGIPFVLECLKKIREKKDIFVLIVGDGTEFGKLEEFFLKENPSNMKLLKRLPKEDYDKMIVACDIGLIFLDYKFTIPNFPSRLLVYLQAALPILACTDGNTDIGKKISEGQFGIWCESDCVENFDTALETLMKSNLNEMSENALKYLKEQYDVQIAYNIILSSCER